MQDSIYTTINTSSVDRIEHLSKSIVSDASQIHTILHHDDSLSIWDSICMWFQNYSLWNNIQDLFHMDGWNLFITLFVNCLSLYVLIRGIFIVRTVKADFDAYIRKLDDKKKTRKAIEKNTKDERTKVKEHFWKICWSIVVNCGKHLILLPNTIIDFGCTIIDYWNNRIKFDREILSTNGYPLLKLSIKLAVLLPLIVTFIIAPIGLISQMINGGSYTSALGVYDTKSAEYTNILWATISQYMDPGNLSNSDSIGSIFAIIMAASGILCLSGLMVSSLVNWISQRRDRWQKGLIVYEDVRSFCDYVVIIGINEQTASIVRQSLNRDGVKYVLIQTRKDVEKARLDLELKMDDELEDRIVFYAGERTSAEDLAKLQLEKAIEIYVLGESVNEPYEKDHDAFNISCLEHISQYIRNNKAKRSSKNKLRVHVDFEYQSTFTAFKATHIYQKLDRDIEFVPFNVHEIWAKKILVDNYAIIPGVEKGEFKVQRYNPIDTYTDEKKVRLGITEKCTKNVHLIVLGMNQMGTALATQAALLCHFPNFSDKNKIRTTITFIDDHAKEEADYYIGRFSSLFQLSRHRIIVCDGKGLAHEPNNQSVTTESPYHIGYGPYFDPMSVVELGSEEGKYDHLLSSKDTKKESFLDIQWEFIQGNIASEEIKKYIADIASDSTNTTTIAICFNNSQQAIASAMYMPENVYKDANQVLVYQQNCFDIVDDVANGDVEWKRYPNLFPFGMIEGAYTENQFENQLAKLFNYQYHNENFTPDEYLLKTIDKTWEQLGIVQKLSNIDLADSVHIKYRSMGINNAHSYANLPHNLDNMANSEHLRWVTERLMTGFKCLSKVDQKPFANRKERLLYVNQRKRRLIDKERAHLDICTTQRLEDVDPDVYCKNNDKKLIANLPWMLKYTEWVSVLRLFDNRYQNSQHVNFLKSFFMHNEKELDFHFIEGAGGTEKNSNITNHSFWMAELPVTQSQWKKVMGIKKNVESNPNIFMIDDMPVVNVSKQDVDDFLDILRKRTGLYFSLPSLKEWKYAAIKTLDEAKYKDQYATWIDKTSKENSPAPVYELSDVQSSSTGIRHILGNVWEWTREEVANSRFEFCGGSWRFTKREIDLKDDYWHNSWEKEMKSDDLGFRLIWKFDLRHYGSIPLEEMLNNKENTLKGIDNNELIKAWFNSRNGTKTGENRNRMIKVEPGSFVMGANESKDKTADKNERPRHDVYIPHAFYVCDIPVTQLLWNLVMNEEKNPSTNRLGDNLPQTDISWDRANEFIDKLNNLVKSGKLEGVVPSDAPIDYIFRLPTEAEWEYAAKGGHNYLDKYESSSLVKPSRLISEKEEVECDYEVKDVVYPLYAGSDNADDVAWYSDSVIRDVALKKPNRLNLYDMSGNIWEWCYDFYVWDMYEKGNSVYPVALDKTYSAHVFRGGSWRSTKWDCRCTRANYWIASHRSNDLGLRLVLGRPIKNI